MSPLTQDIEELPRAVAFIDGQNLIHDATREFGYDHLNIDVKKLALSVCETNRWKLTETRFYTGVPTLQQNPTWKQFWDKKLFQMRLDGVQTIASKLKDRETQIILYKHIRVTASDSSIESQTLIDTSPCWVTDRGYCLDHGTVISQTVFTEKGIDVSIAVDAMKYALESLYDVCLMFSRDSDLSPAVVEIKNIGIKRQSKVPVATVFPSSKGSDYGIPHADLTIRIPKSMYDKCLDSKDYFRRKL